MKKPSLKVGFEAVTTIGATGLVVLAAVVPGPSHADAMLFPVMTRSPTVATIVSVVNKDPQGVVNLNYFTKSADLASPCIDEGIKQVSASGRANDMLTFDASGVFLSSEGSGPLFNDPQTLAPYGGVQFSTTNTGLASLRSALR